MTTELAPGLVTAEHLALAATLADAAGAVIRPYFRAGVDVDDKADASPVTIADREAELAMRRLIEARFPDHGIFGEEHGIVRGDADFVWILDPVDGTKSFVAGLPLFVTLIALTWRGKPILGVIDQPITGERWIGAIGHGTTLNGKPVTVRRGRALADATAFFLPHAGPDDPDEKALDALRRRIKLFR
ncbi:MAG: inositol monophosphatase family protein, partial [Ferrovibrionaceae bacterium]